MNHVRFFIHKHMHTLLHPGTCWAAETWEMCMKCWRKWTLIPLQTLCWINLLKNWNYSHFGSVYFGFIFQHCNVTLSKLILKPIVNQMEMWHLFYFVNCCFAVERWLLHELQHSMLHVPNCEQFTVYSLRTDVNDIKMFKYFQNTLCGLNQLHACLLR